MKKVDFFKYADRAKLYKLLYRDLLKNAKAQYPSDKIV